MEWRKWKQWVLPGYGVNARSRECKKNLTWLRTTCPSSLHQCQSIIPLRWRHLKATRGDREDKQSCTKGYGSTKSILKAASLQEWWPNKFRCCGERPQTQRQGLTPRPFLGKHPSPYGNPYQKSQKGREEQGDKALKTTPVNVKTRNEVRSSNIVYFQGACFPLISTAQFKAGRPKDFHITGINWPLVPLSLTQLNTVTLCLSKDTDVNSIMYM